MDRNFFAQQPYAWRMLGPAQFDTQFELWVSKMLFGGDATRVLYAPNNMCFRYRLEDNMRSKRTQGYDKNWKPQNLEFPFLNYHCDDIPQDDPNGWIHRPGIEGMFDRDYDLFVRSAPVVYQYSATVWTSSVADWQYVLGRLSGLRYGLVDFIIEYEVETADGNREPFQVYAKLKFDIGNGDWDESEWLERNHITSVKMNFTVETVMHQYKPTIKDPATPNKVAIYGDTQQETIINLTEWVRLEFQSAKNLSSLEDVEKYILEHSI